MLNQQMRQMASAIREQATKTTLPAGLHKKVAALLQMNPSMPWDAAIAELAATKP